MHDFEGYQRLVYESYKWLANGLIEVLQVAFKREGKLLQLMLDHRGSFVSTGSHSLRSVSYTHL